MHKALKEPLERATAPCRSRREPPGARFIPWLATAPGPRSCGSSSIWPRWQQYSSW